MSVEFFKVEHKDGTEEIAVITNSDGSYTSMPKAIWDEQQKAAELGETL